MKIAIVATNGPSLANFRGPLIREWVNMGHEVICISIEDKREIEGLVKALGASYYQVEGDRTGIGIGSSIKMILDYIRTFRIIKPDYCFLYMSKPVAFGCPAAAIAGVKHINVLVNGLENAFYRHTFKDALVRFVSKIGYLISSIVSDNVFFQNRDDAEFLIKKKVVFRRKVKMLNGSGVDMEHFNREDLPNEAHILMIARLLWSKGIREFLEAISIVKKNFPTVKVSLVGGLDNNDEALSEEELKKCIREYDIDYCGQTNDVRPYLKECSIFVLPSYHEGTPRAVLEAMATGRPIVTTDAPGCRETVVDGLNGFLVPVRDYVVLAEKLCLLIDDINLRQNMANNSYDLCRQKYDVHLVNAEINRFMFNSNVNNSK